MKFAAVLFCLVVSLSKTIAQDAITPASHIDRFNGKSSTNINGGDIPSGSIGIQSEGGGIDVRKVHLGPLNKNQASLKFFVPLRLCG